jgi:hypothetical protein
MGSIVGEIGVELAHQLLEFEKRVHGAGVGQDVQLPECRPILLTHLEP